MDKKKLTCVSLIMSALFVMSCSTKSTESNYYRSSADSNLVASPTAVLYSPANISICNENSAHPQAIEHITSIEVDVYNEYGIKRQEAQINQMLKEQAYSVGGDAVIIKNNSDKKHCYAEVIRTQPPTKNEGSLTSTSATTSGSATK